MHAGHTAQEMVVGIQALPPQPQPPASMLNELIDSARSFDGHSARLIPKAAISVPTSMRSRAFPMAPSRSRVCWAWKPALAWAPEPFVDLI
jgi:hypothetical protein